jgi:hypothetical protein
MWDERTLITRLQVETLKLIHATQSLLPIKRLVEAAEILDLTRDINDRFPVQPPDLPICDEGALIRLDNICSELYVCYRQELPIDMLVLYNNNVRTLLMVYRLPKDQFD